MEESADMWLRSLSVYVLVIQDIIIPLFFSALA